MGKNIPPIGPKGQDLSIYVDHDPTKIPDEIKAIPRWVCFNPTIRDGKVTKPPIDPKTGNAAKVNDPSTWTTFEVAEVHAKENKRGIGIVLDGSDDLVGIDLDHCVTTNESGKPQIEQRGIDIAKLLKSYTEISPSGTGLRILCRGTLPPGKNRVGNVEAYSSGRYVTVTGKQFGSFKTIEERSKELVEFYNRFLGEVLADKKTIDVKPANSTKTLRGNSGLTDEQLLKRARDNKRGPRFKAFFDEGLTSWSEDNWKISNWNGAAFDLLKSLAFWSGKDREQMKRLFERSKLFNSRNTGTFDGWYDQTIENAISETRNTYQSGHKTMNKAATSHREERGASPSPLVVSSDEAVLQRIRSSKQGPKFDQLWKGDTSSNNGDDSASDLALCNILAFWCGPNSNSQVDRLFRQSGLMRDKWDEKHGAKTYGETTIDKAFEGRTDFASQIQQVNNSVSKLLIKQEQEKRQDKINLAIVALSDLIQRAKIDHSIVLKDKDIFKALLTLKRLDKPSYESLFDQLKLAKNNNVKELDSRINEAIKTEIEKEKIEERNDKGKTQQEEDKKKLGFVRPVITNGNDMSFIVDRLEEALLKLPEKRKIYQRAGTLVNVSREPIKTSGIKRQENSVNISTISKDGLHELSSLAARWESPPSEDNKYGSSIQAPEWPSRFLLARPFWKFDPLLGIVECPTLVGSGVILSNPGYDYFSGLFSEFNTSDFPPISETPTQEDAIEAIKALKEPLQEFPFVEACDMAAMLAAILTPLARHAIDGHVPLFAIRATAPGTGKSFLADIVSIIATGRSAPRWAPSTNDEEDRKRLLSVALAGDQIILIDNVAEPLGSPALDMALTGGMIRDRILGASKIVEAPWRAVVLATGNNLQVKGDMARRVIPVDLDAESEHPEERSDFTIQDILGWTRKNRGRLVSAALTVLRAYIVAGKPKQKITAFGSFEEWSDLVRSCLIWTGEIDPCAGRHRIREASDPARDGLRSLLISWSAFVGYGALTLSEVLESIEKAIKAGQYHNATDGEQERGKHADELFQALGFFDRRFDGKHLNSKMVGSALRKNAKRVVDGLRLVESGKVQGVVLWKVEVVGVKPDASGGLGGLGGFLPSRSPQAARNFENVGNKPTNSKIEEISTEGRWKNPPNPPNPPNVEKHLSSHLQAQGFPDPEGEALEDEDLEDEAKKMESLEISKALYKADKIWENLK